MTLSIKSRCQAFIDTPMSPPMTSTASLLLSGQSYVASEPASLPLLRNDPRLMATNAGYVRPKSFLLMRASIALLFVLTTMAESPLVGAYQLPPFHNRLFGMPPAV